MTRIDRTRRRWSYHLAVLREEGRRQHQTGRERRVTWGRERQHTQHQRGDR